MALLQLMRKMGYGPGGERGPYVPHGFRSSFRDWAGEVSSFPRDVAEMALAHVIENKVEAAYRRGDLFAKRRQLMQAWADFLKAGAGQAGRVIALRSGRRGNRWPHPLTHNTQYPKKWGTGIPSTKAWP